MGKRLTNNFKKRFGDPIKVVYPDKPLEGEERRIQNEKIFQTYAAVLSGILKREPTTDEIAGVKELSKKKL